MNFYSFNNRFSKPEKFQIPVNLCEKSWNIFYRCEGSRQKSPARLGLGSSSGLKRLSTSLRKTPSKSQRRSPSRVGTPGRDGSTTPGGADRFIPNRAAMDFDTSHYKLIREVSPLMVVLETFIQYWHFCGSLFKGKFYVWGHFLIS